MDLQNLDDLGQEIKENVGKYSDALVSPHYKSVKSQLDKNGRIKFSTIESILSTKQQGLWNFNRDEFNSNSKEGVEKSVKESIEILDKQPLEDRFSNIEIAIERLTDIKGVGVASASAILAVYNPWKYAVIDRKAVKQLNKHDWNKVTVKDYNKSESYGLYLTVIEKLAEQLNLTPREIDQGLFLIESKDKPEEDSRKFEWKKNENKK
jgi:hypothetical protein